MILSKEDAHYAAGIFENYFANFDRIDDYMRKVKLERVQNMPASLPGFDIEDDMFQEFDMHPSEMNIEVRKMACSDFCNYLEIVSSHANEKNIPGRDVFLSVHETNTQKILGFIRLGSSTINSKPRNQYLGRTLNTTDRAVMKRFNDSVMMGFVIVPVQPFGYNYLGGKLLAGICCSHYVRRMLNDKYDANICLFETTSLYGSSKSASQYDGMKPFLRYIGLTDSNFIPALNEETYHLLYNWFVELNGGHLVPPEATSKKMKRQAGMINITHKSLKMYDEVAAQRFKQSIDAARNLTEKKRTYISTYGYDNVAEYLNLETDTLRKKDNFDRYELESIVDWWKGKASKRYETLKQDGRLRSELEVWSRSTDLDIIR